MEKIWMAQLEGLGSYSIEVLGTSEKDAMSKLKKEYNNNWKASKGGGKSFNEIMEYNGGFVQELTLGKVYIDGFRD
tara:strand:- start:318 stop:545 length:228 start_codon:yes stop_codon:yes gene_type:complete